MNSIDLKLRTAKDLATLAKKKNIPGWHAMRKEELIKALKKLSRSVGNANGKTTLCKPLNTVMNSRPPTNDKKRHSGLCDESRHLQNAKKQVRNPQIEERLSEIKHKLAHLKDLAEKPECSNVAPAKDRLVVMVRDPFWLHAYWELTRKSIERAKVAMNHFWHSAKPILRLSEVHRDGEKVAARVAVRDIEIHGGVHNWYIDVHEPPKTYQLEIGYLAANGNFYALARSNVVTTPTVGVKDTFDKNWADVAKEFDRIYAMSGGYAEPEANGELKEVLEEHLHRPMGDPMATQFGLGASGKMGDQPFQFEVDTELIIHGVTDPNAHVTLHGEPVRLRSDGTFAVRFHLPDRRHILPVVASSRDGAEQRTIVLSLDRNTKVMEPLLRDPTD
jgi:uncharacterized protein